MDKIIYMGFFKGSQGEGRIQISADVYGLIEMHDVFYHLSKGLDTFNFSDLRLLDKKYRINIVAYSDTKNLGLKPTDKGIYEWRVTKEKWNEFRVNILTICDYSTEQHIHLESNSADNSDLPVKVSLNGFNQFSF